MQPVRMCTDMLEGLRPHVRRWATLVPGFALACMRAEGGPTGRYFNASSEPSGAIPSSGTVRLIPPGFSSPEYAIVFDIPGAAIGAQLGLSRKTSPTTGRYPIVKLATPAADSPSAYTGITTGVVVADSGWVSIDLSARDSLAGSFTVYFPGLKDISRANEVRRTLTIRGRFGLRVPH